jgi:AraC-like DNA-binding protein
MAPQGEHKSMSKQTFRDPSETLSAASETQPDSEPNAHRRAADVEMARVLGTAPFRVALDSSGAGIAHWKAMRLLAAHSSSPTTCQPIMGGLSPKVLARAIERLRSDSDADVSLDAIASDAGLSRFHFCRAFKESTGPSPHVWLRQHRLDQAMNLLSDTDASIAQVAAELGFASQTAFAAAFRRLSGKTPSEWRRRVSWQ